MSELHGGGEEEEEEEEEREATSARLTVRCPVLSCGSSYIRATSDINSTL